MPLNTLRDALPDYALDQRTNVDALTAEALLSDQQKWGCFLGCAYATGVSHVIASFEAEAAARLTPAARTAVQSAAVITAMNTVYYRAINLLQNHTYRAAPARLSMTTLSQTYVDKIDFELWSFAISAVHGCGACLNAHEAELHKRGVTIERVQAALRIASTVTAIAAAVSIENAAAQ